MNGGEISARETSPLCPEKPVRASGRAAMARQDDQRAAAGQPGDARAEGIPDSARNQPGQGKAVTEVPDRCDGRH